MARPLLLLDVDGVLQPVGTAVPPGYRRVSTPDVEVVVRPEHEAWLRPLVERCDARWASTWGDRASLVGAVAGLPRLPALALGDLPRDGTRKLGAVRAAVGDRPLVWIDDELYDDALAWADARPAPTLLVRTRAGVGLTVQEVDRVVAWLDGLA